MSLLKSYSWCRERKAKLLPSEKIRHLEVLEESQFFGLQSLWILSFLTRYEKHEIVQSIILLHVLKMILLFPEVLYSIFISLRGIARPMQTAWVIILHFNKYVFANHILSWNSQFQVSVSSDLEWWAIRGMKRHCSRRRCFRSHLKPRNKYSHAKIETK